MPREVTRVTFSRIVDLSQEIGPDTQVFPAYPKPAFTQWTTREAHGFLAESLFLLSHTGTHVDAPWHFEPKGKKLDQLPLETFLVRGHVLYVRGLGPKALIAKAQIAKARAQLHVRVAKGDAMLLRTGWERRRGTSAYLFENPGLSEEAAKELVRWKVGLVGIDTANIDHPEDGRYPAHHTLLAAGIPILENVANLAALGASRFFLIALPLRLKGATGSPIRLVALVE